ncbi:MAG: histidine kinase [Methanobacterium sp. BRmetb2]|nr:MAG: histidine kinase [Methanobacterium sp. BRmetb2]
MKKLEILVVEDESITALDLKEKLENLGYSVPAINSTGEQAIKTAAQIHPDLVLMDIVLKGETDGIKAAEKIQTLNIPVIYLTAYSDQQTINRIKKQPSYGYIIKPYNEKELQTNIDMAIQKHKQEESVIETFEGEIVDKKHKIKSIEEIEEMKPPKILVVEDESITALDLKSKLENLGYFVPAINSTGEQAIKTAAQIHPDLVLMDIVLKGETDGIKAAEKIQTLNIPVIYLTAYSDQQTINRIKKQPSYGYIIKPYNEKELQTNIDMAIQKHKQEEKTFRTAEEKIQSKKRELIIEKLGVSLIIIGIIILIIHSLITKSLGWLSWLLFIPAYYGLMLTVISFLPPKGVPESYEEQFVSIIIPAHNEENTIEKCVRSISKLDYFKENKRNFELIVINDGSTDKTNQILLKLVEELDFLKVITRKPPRAGKGKGYVLNDGLKLCSGDVVAVFDADARVKPDFLKKVIPYMGDDDVDGVQTKVKMYNKNRNVLTSMQHIEFAIFGNVILRARDKIGGGAFLGGNGQVATRKVIEKLGGWDGFAVTEDLNMSIKMMIKGCKIRYCEDTAVYQEAVPHWKPFFRQRVRWAMGNLETFFVYLKQILGTRNIPLYRRLDVIQYLSSLLFLSFVMLGYIVAILYITDLMIFNYTFPAIIGILSTIAFFPAVMLGIYRDNRKIHVTIYRSVEYWAYCLYLIPLFIVAFIKLILRKDRKWAKTYHTGD